MSKRARDQREQTKWLIIHSLKVEIKEKEQTIKQLHSQLSDFQQKLNENEEQWKQRFSSFQEDQQNNYEKQTVELKDNLSELQTQFQKTTEKLVKYKRY